MQFLHTDVGQLDAGAVAVVTLGTAANVRLLDDLNFRAFQAGRAYRGYHMAFYRSSPVRLRVPSPGHWHVVIDLGGHAGTIRASVQVLTPTIR